MLEAFASSFAAVFAGVCDDGTLHRTTRTNLGGGDFSVSEDDIPIRGQVDQLTETMRASAGYTAKQQRLLILQNGLDRFTTDDEITLGGVRWSVSACEADPLNTHWVVRGERA